MHLSHSWRAIEIPSTLECFTVLRIRSFAWRKFKFSLLTYSALGQIKYTDSRGFHFIVSLGENSREDINLPAGVIRLPCKKRDELQCTTIKLNALNTRLESVANDCKTMTLQVCNLTSCSSSLYPLSEQLLNSAWQSWQTVLAEGIPRFLHYFPVCVIQNRTWTFGVLLWTVRIWIRLKHRISDLMRLSTIIHFVRQKCWMQREFLENSLRQNK